MYVCQCRAVTDRQVKGAIAEGCTTMRTVAAVTGAGTGCGGCLPTLRDLVCSTCPSGRVAVPCDDGVTPLPEPAVSDVADSVVVDPQPYDIVSRPTPSRRT